MYLCGITKKYTNEQHHARWVYGSSRSLIFRSYTSPVVWKLQGLQKQNAQLPGEQKRIGHGGFGHLTRMRAPQSNDPQTKTTSGQYEVGGFISEIQILKIEIPTAKPADPAKSKKSQLFETQKPPLKMYSKSKVFSKNNMVSFAAPNSQQRPS